MSIPDARERALEFAHHLREMGPVDVSRFFGGAGLVWNDVQFAFVMKGTLYFRVDDASRRAFEALGAAPFTYAARTRTVRVASYYEVPDAVVEDAGELRRWALRACSAAMAGKPTVKRHRRAGS